MLVSAPDQTPASRAARPARCSARAPRVVFRNAPRMDGWHVDSCSIEACVNNGRECSGHPGSAAAASYASLGRHPDAKCDFSPQVSAKVPLPLSLC